MAELDPLLLLLPELAPLEVLELEAEFVSDSTPADVDADAAASPLGKLFPGTITDTGAAAAAAAAEWIPFTAAEEVVVVVVEAYEEELAAVDELVPSPFAVRAAASLSIVLFVGRSKLFVFVRQVLYAPQ